MRTIKPNGSSVTWIVCWYKHDHESLVLKKKKKKSLVAACLQENCGLKLWQKKFLSAQGPLRKG